jgi:LuxR family transcriptional regulator, maltose regulon positive regulatory protein
VAPPPQRPLAKIDPPRLSDIYQRKRVFALLDGFADCRVIWLSAPPGYGKTIAVASWLQSRPGRVIWYHCDEGDADIASFFYFLSRALADYSSTKGTPPPSLTPELYAALPTFVRNYFREFCARLTAPTFVVLDNWQDIPAGAPLRDLLPIAIGELPAGIVLVIISREEPPANLSRLRVTAQMATLGWADLKLTEQETVDIAARYRPANDQRSGMPARDLYAVTQGWAVGLAVMLRYEAGQCVTHMDVNQVALQAVFDYLTSEVFDRLSDTVKDFLLKTACLEYISVPVAEQLTGNTAAHDILDSLTRSNAFTLRRQASATYYYHPLFRQLLRSRAAARLSDVEQQQLLTAAAGILAENQDSEMAINLFVEARRWQEASQMVMSIAPTLLQQGRFRTLSGWIETLPEPLLSRSAWLTYWRGMVQMAIAFPAAAQTFQHAYKLFVEEREKLGQMLAIAAILRHLHISYAGYGRMVPWIGVLEDLLRTEPSFPSPSAELSVLTGVFSAMLLANQTNLRLTKYRDRIAQLMRSDLDQQSRVSAAIALTNYFALSGDIVQWRALLPDSEWAGDHSELGPASCIQYLWMQAYQYQLTGETDRCEAMLQTGLDIAKRHNLPLFATRLTLSKLQATDYTSHAAELSEGLSRLEPELAHAPQLVLIQFRYVNAMFHFAEGNLPAATRDIETADAMMRDTGYELARILILVGMGEIMSESGRLNEAAACLLRCQQIIGDLQFPLMDFNMGLLKAEIARRSGNRAEFIDALAAALAVGRRQGFANGFHAYSVILPRLIPYALEHNIEVEYCRRLIRKRNFQPPAREVLNWPWPIQIYTLGRFQIQVNDRALEVRGKSQRRPLNLLKAMLVSRNGEEITELIDRFWPDLDGDAARNAFDLAVHRLRKLLKGKNAVVVSQGRAALNRNVVWVDAFALAALGEANDTDETPSERARRVLLLYRGPFLVDEAEPWMFAPRERMRSQFLRYVGQIGDILQASHCYDLLTDFYQRVLEIEPLAEEVYRNLMHCLIAQGFHAEALRVYHRCDEFLSTALHARPSPPTRNLYAWLVKQ